MVPGSGAVSGPAAACAGSVRVRPKASRDLVDAPASRARRRWVAQGEKWVSSSLAAAPLLFARVRVWVGVSVGFDLGFLGSFLSGFFGFIAL
jgi:hypothetical protein